MKWAPRQPKGEHRSTLNMEREREKKHPLLLPTTHHKHCQSMAKTLQMNTLQAALDPFDIFKTRLTYHLTCTSSRNKNLQQHKHLRPEKLVNPNTPWGKYTVMRAEDVDELDSFSVFISCRLRVIHSDSCLFSTLDQQPECKINTHTADSHAGRPMPVNMDQEGWDTEVTSLCTVNVTAQLVKWNVAFPQQI